MNAQSIHADQIDFQDTATDQSTTTGFSPLAELIACYQDAQRVEREAHEVYAMSTANLREMGISLHADIPVQLAKMYR